MWPSRDLNLRAQHVQSESLLIVLWNQTKTFCFQGTTGLADYYNHIGNQTHGHLLSRANNIAPDKGSIFFLHENIVFGFSLEVPILFSWNSLVWGIHMTKWLGAQSLLLFLAPHQLGPNIHWTSNYGTGIVFIGNMLSWLSFHNFVWWNLNAHISVIFPNISDLFSKSNRSIYYL